MKTMKGYIAGAIIGAGILAAGVISCKKEMPKPESAAESTITAQSFMIDVQGANSAVITGTQTWHFDELSAAIANHRYNSCNPATSGKNHGNQCRAAAVNAARAAKCTYWAADGHPYWVMTNSVSSGSDATFTLNLLIAGESFMNGGQFNNLGKYSFSMRNTDSTSRITTLACQVDGGAPVAITHTLTDGNSTLNNCWLSQVYYASCGPYGNPAAYSYLQTGTTIGDILASDDHSGNDSGCPSIALGQSGPLLLTLAPGNHTLTVHANVKGNQGMSDVVLTQSVQLTVSAEGCQ